MSLQTRLSALIVAIGADIKSLNAGKADASKGVTNGDAHDHSGGDGGQIAYSSLSGLPALGTAAPLNVAASGNAAAGEVVKGNDSRLSDAREWSAATVSQVEAEAGTATTRRAWTAQRVRQAIVAWWDSVKGALVGPIALASGGFSIARTRVTSPDASDGNVFSGPYTPTLTNVANVSSSTAYVGQYLRVGNTVTVSMRIDVTITASAALSDVRISLPITSALTSSAQAAGCASPISSESTGAILGDAANDAALLRVYPLGTGAKTYFLTFTYQVI